MVDLHEIPDDVEAGVAARTARAQFLGQGGRTYHVLLGEQTLRTNMGGADVALYERAFGLLERSAVYGGEARGLVEEELRLLG